MGRIKHNDEELSRQLDRQLKLIKKHLQGFEEEPILALDLATKVRVLCHDTKNQTSLFTALGLLDSIRIPDTYATRSVDNPNAPFCGMVYINLDYTGAKFIPKFGNHPKDLETINLQFKEWWQATILRDYEGRELSRRELILEVADTDGGAHVDSGLNENYHFISRQHSLTWTFKKNNYNPEPISGVELASVAQIAYELLKALKPQYTPPDFSFDGLIGEFSIKGSPGEAIFGKKLPFRMEMKAETPSGSDRNKLCKCGSGKKAKHCCPQGTNVAVYTKPL